MAFIQHRGKRNFWEIAQGRLYRSCFWWCSHWSDPECFWRNSPRNQQALQCFACDWTQSIGQPDHSRHRDAGNQWQHPRLRRLPQLMPGGRKTVNPPYVAFIRRFYFLHTIQTCWRRTVCQNRLRTASPQGTAALTAQGGVATLMERSDQTFSVM